LNIDTIKPGDRFDLGSYTMRRDEMTDFAGRYDPQPYHLDDAAAQAHPFFERLSASGWHTTMVLHRLWFRFAEARSLKTLAGVEVENIRWLRPVYPDDVLSGEIEFLKIRPSESKPDRSLGTIRTTLVNQKGEQVASMVVTAIFIRNPVQDRCRNA
jgi:acyl dehydratase